MEKVPLKAKFESQMEKEKVMKESTEQMEEFENQKKKMKRLEKEKLELQEKLNSIEKIQAEWEAKNASGIHKKQFVFFYA